MKKSTIVSSVILGIGIVSLVIFLSQSEDLPDTKTSQQTNAPSAPYYLATSSLSVPVVGTVTAAKQATIYAQTAGVITALPYQEGAVVTAGVTLSVQSTPVLSAEANLAQTQVGLTGAQQRAAVSARADQAQGASARLYTATELAQLRAVQNDARTAESLDTLLRTVQANAAVTLATMDYVSNNRSLFSADGLRLFEQVLRDGYGIPPGYFNGGIMYGGGRTLSLREQLEMIQDNEVASPLAVENATTVTLSMLETLAQVLQTAERYVFARGTESEETTNAYLAQKSAVASATLELTTTKQLVRQVVDAALEDAVVQGSSVTVSEIDEAAALAQRDFAVDIADWSTAVATAQVGVVAAQASLGTVKAPFSGVVSRVLVEEGEYVSPGTPLLELVGDGVREIAVTVPATLGASIEVGQAFLVDGEVVGTVDRVSPTTVGKGQTIMIALNRSVALVGESVRGFIETESGTTVYVVPRAYVSFSSDGAFIRYEDGEVSPVRILHDAVGTLYLEVATVLDKPLSPVLGVSL